MIPAATQAANATTVSGFPESMAVSGDFQVQQLLCEARAMHANACELQESARRTKSETYDEEARLQADHAEKQALLIRSTAEKIECEVRNAKIDPKTGRKQISCQRVQDMGCALKQLQHVPDDEKCTLGKVHDEAVVHQKAAETAKEPVCKPVTAPTVAPIAAPVRKLAKHAVPVVAGAAAAHAAPTVALPVAETLKTLQQVKAVAVSGWQKATHVAKETLHAVQESQMVHTVKHGYDAVLKAGNASVDWMREKKDKFVAMLPWRDKPQAKLAVVAKNSPVVPKPPATCSGVSDCVKQKAAAILAPLALEWHDMTHQVMEFVPHSLPNISAVLSHLPGIH